MALEPIKIFPRASELTEILNHLECPEEKCSEVFQSTPNLNLHLLKTHGKEKMSLKTSAYGYKTAQFYCPENGCKYFNQQLGDEANSKFSSRYFSQFKYLKQVCY